MASRTTAGFPGARERRVVAGEVELAVAELGEPTRPTVLLLHGYPDTKEVWSELAGRLAERFHVVLYDVRGHGGSTAPVPLRGGFTLAKLTDDFLAVADAVSPGRALHLVGHDWGSVQGWEFVTGQRAEGRIASFTSVSGPSLDHVGHWIRRRAALPTPRRAGQLLGQGARSWYMYLLHAPALPEMFWRGPGGRRWPEALRRAGGITDATYPAPSYQRDAANGVWLYRDNVRARLRAPRADPRVHVPVQLVVPTRDPFLSEHLYDDLERWVPHLVRRSLPVRHWAPRSRPDQLASWITDFVTSNEEGRPPVTGRAPRNRYAERFGGQLVLVTGAASGIGRATALAFATAGARIVLVDRDAEGAARAAEEARAKGAGAAWAEAVDVGDEQAMEDLAAKVADQHGVVDVLVNNAGVGQAGAFLDTTPADWKGVLDTNLWGVIHGCRLFGGPMAERGQGGHIVNISSAAVYLPAGVLSAYSTSKAAVLTLSESLRAELAGKGVGVSAICPGFVHTGITRNARFTGVSAEEAERRRARSSRLYRLRNYPPEKVADAVLRAVVRNEAVVPVTPEARGARLLARFAPRVLRAAARIEPPW